MGKMDKNQLTNEYIVSKSVHSYVSLAIATLLFISISLVVDGLFVGNLIGKEGLASFGLASPVLTFIFALAIIFASGGSSLCSNYAGKGEKERMNNNFTINLMLALIVGIIITVTSPIYITPLSYFLGSEGSLINLTISYLSGLMLATIPIILYELLTVYNRLEGFIQLEIISGTAILITNIIFDIVFVVFLNMGMFGIGLATAISFSIGSIIIATERFSKDSAIKLSKIRNSISEIENLLKYGFPGGLVEIYSTVRILIINNLAIIIGGTIVVGALSIQAEINHLLTSIKVGFGAITVLLGGIFFGERDKRSLTDVLKVTLKSGTIITLIITALVIIFAPILVDAFADNESLISTGIFSLRLFALSLPLSLICTIILNFYISTKNTFLANYVAFSHSFLFITLFALILTPVMGENGIWICFFLGELMTLIGLLIIIKRKTGKFPHSLEDFIFINDDFEKDIESTLNISIENNMEEVMELSNRVYEFGNKYIEDKSIRNKISLCIEEIAGNIVKHGYKSSKKVHYIDIRIIITTENIIFRIRDDGTPFSPIEYSDKHKYTESHIGIHMIQGISKKMEYRSTIGLNNLTITL